MYYKKPFITISDERLFAFVLFFILIYGDSLLTYGDGLYAIDIDISVCNGINGEG